MVPREFTEQSERERLSEFAVLSAKSKGRKRTEDKCDYRTDFQRDRDRITHSKAFRRLSHKTQVFISPDGDHYRTRLSHTLELAQIARTIARALRLNEDLTEAIALGHDLGHTPFGHTGEDALNEMVPGGFRHNEQSVRILERIENNFNGLNLTAEVIDGIYHHCSDGSPGTLEGRIVQLADKIAYVNHDIDDAVRGGILDNNDLPGECVALLGKTGSKRIGFLVKNIVDASAGKNQITLDPEPKRVFFMLREFMFATVYSNQLIRCERQKIHHMIRGIYEHFTQNPSELPHEFARDGEDICRQTADYIACMTDRYALKVHTDLAMPENWNRH